MVNSCFISFLPYRSAPHWKNNRDLNYIIGARLAPWKILRSAPLPAEPRSAVRGRIIKSTAGRGELWMMVAEHLMFYLNTHSFSYQEQLILQSALCENFGIICNINRHESQYKLYIRSKSMKTFRSLVYPHFIPSMLYKLYSIKNTK